MTYVIKLQSGEFLGRTNLNEGLKPVPLAFAYCYETKEQADQMAAGWGGGEVMPLSEAQPQKAKRFDAFNRDGKLVRVSVPESDL